MLEDSITATYLFNKNIGYHIMTFGIWDIDNNGDIVHNRKELREMVIPRTRLLEKRPSTIYYDWPLHISDKTWVDKNDLLELHKAIKYVDQKYKHGINTQLLQESFDEAIKVI